jgi:HD-GYP domain-containing protein (c-di-GMP phosphodiesterase class II)/DNA-binding CsgD family transcriptional regulator
VDHLRTADLLGALSLASDLALGLPAEHVLRSCYIGMRVAEQLNVPPGEQVHVYYAELLMDAGCTAWTSQLATFLLGDEIAARQRYVFFVDPNNPLAMLGWVREHVAVDASVPRRARRAMEFAMHGREFAREGFRNTCEVAGRFAVRLGMPDGVRQALLSVFEHWDGHGPRGTRGASIPLAARIVYASSFFEVFDRLGGREAAVRLARRKRGSAFDPAVVDAFLKLADSEQFWADLEQDSVWSIVQAMEPPSDHNLVSADQLDEVALAFADFADLKLPGALGHSRRVADLAERLGRRAVLPRRDVATLRLAGLLHDLGLVAVPSHTLAKPRPQLSQAEWERVRLHPYHAERILARVPALAAAAALVAAHHERFDGQGYPHGTPAARLSLEARLLVTADRYDELSQDGRDREQVLAEMAGEAGQALCPQAFSVLSQELGSAGAPAPPKPPRPAGLSEREVEILRLLAGGCSRREIADDLVLSEHTVRHHLEHIYTKLGVETRVAAALFAVEHGLVA